MSTGHGPTLTRRRLRAELRRLRIDRSLSVEEVSNEVEWSTSKLIRIENGQVGISKSDLTALLTMYGVNDPAYIADLQELARASRQRMWWSAYQRFIPAPYLEFLGAEADVSRVWHYQPMIVPGLLQIKPYTVAINEGTALTELAPEVAAARSELRLRRQKELLGRVPPAELVFIMDEGVLRRPIGGTAVMRDQLDHIVEVAQRDNVSLTVVPFSAGAHIGLYGPFALLEYADPQNEDLVYLENAASNTIFRDQPTIVDNYRRAAERLVKIGLRDKRATDLIKRIRADFA